MESQKSVVSRHVPGDAMQGSIAGQPGLDARLTGTENA